MARHGGPPGLLFGKVYGQTFALLGARGRVLFPLALVIGAAPIIGLNLGATSLMHGARWTLTYWGVRAGGQIITLYLFGLLAIATVHIVLSSAQAGRQLLVETGAMIAPRLVPLALVVAIYQSPALLTLLSTLPNALPGAGYRFYGLQILAGPIVFCLGLVRTLWVGASMPVFAEEPLGVFAVLRRAAALLAGRRWSFLKVYAPVVVFSLVTNGGLNFIARFFGRSLIGQDLIVISAAIYAVTAMFSAVFFAVCYRELRLMKDGSAKEIADVFE